MSTSNGLRIQQRLEMIIGRWNHPPMLTLLQRDYQERRTLGAWEMRLVALPASSH